MYRTLLALSILLVLAGKYSAASTSGGDISQDLVIKLEALEQKLAAYEQVNQVLVSKQAGHEKIIDELFSKQMGYQEIIGELASKLARYEQINGELSTKQAKYEQMNNELASSLAILQTKLQSTTDECSSMKVQLIKLFSGLSSAKQLEKKQLFSGNNSKLVDTEVERKSRISKAHPLTSEENEEIEKDKSEKISDVDESGGNPITATLQIDATGGVSYIRWGRTVCEGDADLLYTGYAAGKYRPSSSTGSEMICLHGAPQWGDINTIHKGNASITGVEYLFTDDDPFSKENVGGQNLRYHNMPCTVCHVETRSHQLMIPGRRSCPSGWAMEYWGYLVISDYVIMGGSYQCLDQAPESATGGAADQNYVQHVFAAEADCTALPCAPYFQGYEISCVVCSK